MKNMFLPAVRLMQVKNTYRFVGSMATRSEKMNRKMELVQPRAPLRINDVPISSPPPRGMIVKTHYAGLCHSDIHMWRDEWVISDKSTKTNIETIKGFKWDVVPCHEIAGEVYSLGSDFCPGAADFQVGDRVIVYPWVGCRECQPCHAGQTTLCKDGNAPSYGLTKDGGFQSHVTVQERSMVVKAPDSLPLSVGCLLACSGVTAFNGVRKVIPAIHNALKIYGKATALVIGAGGLGLWGISLLRAMFPSLQIVCGDISESNLQLAMGAGASKTICWDPKGAESDLLKQTRAACGGGFDAAVDFVNSKTTLGRAFRAANAGGMICAVGLFGGSMTIPVTMIPLRQVTITGVSVGNLKDLHDLLKFVQDKKIQPPHMQFYALENIQVAIDLLNRGSLRGRAVVDFSLGKKHKL